MTGNTPGFDYRPFVLNWLMSVKLIDGFVVTPIESLKAEWLYSQGCGRQFRVGEHDALAKYLSSVCPLSGEPLEDENERKLRLILSKAQQHQRQLQEQISDPNPSSTNSSPSTLRRRGLNRVQSPRFARLSSNRNKSPDSMSNSYHGSVMNNSITASQFESTLQPQLEMTKSLIENYTCDIMSQSIQHDSLTSLNTTLNSIVPVPDDSKSMNTTNNNNNNSISSPIQAKNQSTPPPIVRSLKEIPLNNAPPQYNDQTSLIISSGPLVAATKMMPVPETLMSPDCPTTTITTQRITHTTTTPQTSKVTKGRTVDSSHKDIGHKDNSHKDTSKDSSDSGRVTKLTKTRPATVPTSKVTKSRTTSSAHVSPNPQKKGGVLKSTTSPVVKEAPVKVALASQPVQHPVKQQTPPPVVHSSDDENEKVNVEKLKTIQDKTIHDKTTAEKNQKQKLNIDLTNVSKTTENSAIMIQKIWRGYCTRKRHRLAEKIQRKRANSHLQKLTKDMEETKAALENERKIQQLQMQVINSLWKKVSALQHQQQQQLTPTATTPSQSIIEESLRSATVSLNFDNQSINVVQDLTKTCSMLMTQVAQLQHSMQDMVSCLTQLSQNNVNNGIRVPSTTISERENIETQTDIVAVSSPISENTISFLSNPTTNNNNNKLLRPSSLPISCSSNETSPKNLRFNSNQLSEPVNEESQLDTAAETLAGLTGEISNADDSQATDNVD